MSKDIKFTMFPTKLTSQQLLELSNLDAEDGYGLCEAIVLEHGFWLKDNDEFNMKRDHYRNLHHIVTTNNN